MSRGDAPAWAAFAACSAIWGSTFLVISIGNDVLAPVWAATLRVALASVLLGAWTLLRGQSLPRGPALRAALGYGVAQFGVNLPLLYWGEKVVPSGVSAVVFATIPFSTASSRAALGLERLTARKILGAVIAFARRRGPVLVDVAPAHPGGRLRGDLRGGHRRQRRDRAAQAGAAPGPVRRQRRRAVRPAP